MAVAGDCPGTFDLVVNGQGYMFDSSYDDSPFRKPPAAYTYTPTFLERTNVGPQWGDNQQDFFLTEAQKDWSLGESRSHFDPATPDGSRMFYSSSGIDPTVEGQITLAGLFTASTLGSNFRAAANGYTGGYYCLNDSHLYTFATTVDNGAHGLGTPAVGVYGMCQDSNNAFLTSTSAGTVGIRKWNGASFSTFSATACDSLAYNGNVLYGAISSTAELASFSTTGVKTSLFIWRDAAGVARQQSFLRLLPFGGDLLILIQVANDRSELWLYDGTATYMVARLPENFTAYELCEVAGVVFLSGQYYTGDRSIGTAFRPAIFTYLNGSLDELWRPPGPIDIVGTPSASNSLPPALCGWHDTLLFTSPTDLMRYDPASGAIYSLGAVTTGAQPVITSAAQSFAVFVNSSTAKNLYAPGRAATTGTVTSAQFDFGSALTKNVRGISIFWTGPAGTSVDISYALNNATSFTSLQVGAVSGTEYAINASARVVQYQLTLHGSGSANYDAPIVARVYIRAVPILTSFPFNTYILDCSGNKAAPQPGMLQLGNGFVHDKDGVDMVTDLRTAIAAGIISVTDRFGTINAIIEPAATTFKEVKSLYGRAEYRVELAVRGV